MGYVSGWMYIAVGVVGLLGLAFPALRFHSGWQLGLGLAAIAYGAITVRDLACWGRRAIATHYTAMFVALPVIGAAIWCTGGTSSYIRPMLLLAPIHWGFFVERRAVLVSLSTGFVLALWTPALYTPGTMTETAITTSAAFSVTIFFLSASLALIKARLAATEARLRALTRRDPLTGLLNRRGFAEGLAQLISATPRGSAPFMVLLDLDNLKPLNDVHGHAAGDEALCAFADRLAAATRPEALLARLGGDELAVAGYAPDADADAVRRIATRLESSVEGELAALEGITISATSGWSLSARDTRDASGTAEELFAHADEQLLARKRARPSPVGQRAA
ncbi:MAG: GGDEF domain-containing protein [Solirubrobacteraceae bacterium]